MSNVTYDYFNGMRITRIAPRRFVAVCLSTGASGNGPSKQHAISRCLANRDRIEAQWEASLACNNPREL